MTDVLHFCWRKWLKFLLAARIIQSRVNYTRDLRRLRKQGKKIKVLFLVSETAKWKLQSVYNAMAGDAFFDPWIALTISDIDVYLTIPEKRKKLESNREFFGLRNMKCVVAYDVNADAAIDLKLSEPDAVFYQTPWNVPLVHLPERVSKFALTYYVPYYVLTYIRSVERACGTSFHRCLFRQYHVNAEAIAFYKASKEFKALQAGEMISVGHPMLDEIVSKCCSVPKDGLVIYSPHWSLALPGFPNAFNLSTFTTTGRIMLEYAKLHPEIRWAFKPHPTLRYALRQSGFMNVTEIDEYYNEWSRIGEVVETGDYLDLFKRSRAMITDCDSFLAEYGFTGKPIVNLIGAGYGNAFSPFSALFSTYYQIKDPFALVAVLDRVIVGQSDYNRENRHRALGMYLAGLRSSAEAIVSDIKETIAR